MQKLFKLKITTDQDLINAIKELSWQGNNAIIRKKELIVEFWGGEQETQCLNLPSATAELLEGYSADV